MQRFDEERLRRGSRFYAMELIEGESLDRVLADLAEKKAKPQRRPDAVADIDINWTRPATTGATSHVHGGDRLLNNVIGNLA